MTYRENVSRIAAATEAKVLAVFDRFDAGDLDQATTIALIASIIARANSRAVTLADLSLAATLMLQLRRPVATLGITPREGEPQRLTKAATTLLAVDNPTRERVARLARAEPLGRAADAYSEGIRRTRPSSAGPDRSPPTLARSARASPATSWPTPSRCTTTPDAPAPRPRHEGDSSMTERAEHRRDHRDRGPGDDTEQDRTRHLPARVRAAAPRRERQVPAPGHSDPTTSRSGCTRPSSPLPDGSRTRPTSPSTKPNSRTPPRSRPRSTSSSQASRTLPPVVRPATSDREVDREQRPSRGHPPVGRVMKRDRRRRTVFMLDAILRAPRRGSPGDLNALESESSHRRRTTETEAPRSGPEEPRTFVTSRNGEIPLGIMKGTAGSRPLRCGPGDQREPSSVLKSGALIMAASTSTAPELTREQVQAILVRPLEDKSIFLAAGPRIFDTDGSPVRIPKMGGATDPDWIGENELITEEDVTFDEVTLLPSTMKSVKVITRYSNELARQSVVALDAALRDRLVTDVASKIDRQLLSAGDGVTTPKGLLAYSGVQSIDKAAGDLGLDDLLDAWGLALSANVNMSGLRWVMRPESFTDLRKVKDSQRYQLQPDPTQDGVFRLFGAPVTVTDRLPLDAETQATVVLADFSQIAVARDMAPSVKVLTERYADYDQQALRVVARYDAAPLNPEAIVKIVNIGAAV